MDETYLGRLLPIGGEIFKTALGDWQARVVSASEPSHQSSTIVTYVIEFISESGDGRERKLDVRVPKEKLAVQRRQQELYAVIGAWLEGEDDSRIIRV